MNDKTRKKTVYIASPYSKGDSAMNAHFQCKIFDQLLEDGKVLPVAPLWSHFQHILFPRKYQDWIDYDQAMISLYDCCLRLKAVLPDVEYSENKSLGADSEVEEFKRQNKPVFYSIDELYIWVSEPGK